MLRVCKCCKVEFEASAKEVKRGNAKYCSKKCFHQSRKGKKVKEPNCVCRFCSASFYRSASKQKRSKSGMNFCNRLCKESAQKLGGITEIMPPHYGSRKITDYRELFENREFKCVRCSYSEFSSCVEIHHIDEDRTNNKKENLLPLCACCHRALHLKLWKLGG